MLLVLHAGGAEDNIHQGKPPQGAYLSRPLPEVQEEQVDKEAV